MEKINPLLFQAVFLKDKPDFYSINDNGNLIINEKYFYRNQDGIVQPQSATVVIDYRTGQIKALVGGEGILKELKF